MTQTQRTTKGVPVSKRALIQRINRRLARDGEKLYATRGRRAFQDLGEFHVIDVDRNFVAQKDVDLEELGRNLKVLSPWEKLFNPDL